MIIRPARNGIYLITQPDHAKLARTIMEQCAPLAERPRRDLILLAIGEHDSGWTEEDANPTVHRTTGRIVDFLTAPLPVRHGVWPRAVRRLAAEPWAAALVAQHAIELHAHYREDAEWTSFFEEMDAERDEMLKRSGLSLSELARDYVFLRLADLISLTFCSAWTETQRLDPWTVQLDDDRVVVTPDLFQGAEVKLAVRAIPLRARPFHADAALRVAIERSEPVILRGVAAGGEPG